MRGDSNDNLGKMQQGPSCMWQHIWAIQGTAEIMGFG